MCEYVFGFFAWFWIEPNARTRLGLQPVMRSLRKEFCILLFLGHTSLAKRVLDSLLFSLSDTDTQNDLFTLRYWQHPLDSCSILIQDRYAIDGEKPQVLLQQRRQNRMGTNSLGLDFQTIDIRVGKQGVFWPTNVLSSISLRSSSHERLLASDVFERWCVDPEAEVPVYLMVEPIADLVFKNAWNTLLYLARWGTLWWSDWPSQAWVREVSGKNAVLTDDAKMSVEDVRSLADDLRRWAPRIADTEAMARGLPDSSKFVCPPKSHSISPNQVLYQLGGGKL